VKKDRSKEEKVCDASHVHLSKVRGNFQLTESLGVTYQLPKAA
jgi:hypothetical protein